MHPPERPAPLNAVLGFTFLNSLGTGAVTSGLFFLTANAFAFGATKNFLLGIVLGAVYICGALASGPLVRALSRSRTAISARTTVTTLMIAGAAICLLPWTAAWMNAGNPPEWSAWVFGLAYLPLTGLLWPIVEAFLSGGRKGQSLRSATGRFNVCWAAALVVAYWMMAPLLETGPLLVLVGLGAVHLIAIAPGWAMGRSPARHLADDAHVIPGSYPGLLGTFRVLLPMSYIVLSTLTPYLPTSLTQLEVPVGWQPVVASTWLVARVFVFGAFERWHGWHGRRWTPIVSVITLVVGFAATISAPLLGDSGLVVLILGLAAVGSAQALIYLAALYYTLEVGTDGVDAGGSHEALIGAGYLIGPGLGLIAALAVGTDSPAFTPTLLTSVSVLAGSMSIFALLRAGKRPHLDGTDHRIAS